MCHFIPTHRRHSSLCGGFYVSSCSCSTDTWNKIKPLQAKVLISWTQWKTGSMGIKQVENLKGNTEQISFFPILKVLFIAVGVTMSFLFCHIYIKWMLKVQLASFSPLVSRRLMLLCFNESVWSRNMNLPELSFSVFKKCSDDLFNELCRTVFSAGLQNNLSMWQTDINTTQIQHLVQQSEN